MSFLAGGRLAGGKEGAYFFNESKQAVTRLADKTSTTTTTTTSAAIKLLPSSESVADVLPEVLKHSLPSKLFRGGGSTQDPSSSLSTGSKWALRTSGVSSVSPDALNPLRAYLSLPQVTFGPKRWELPQQEHEVMASTANELRFAPINPKKLKAAAEGLSMIGKAFLVATVIVFGGAAVTFSFAASKFQLQNTDDIRTKGKDLVQPTSNMIKEQLAPVRAWVEGTSQKWHIEREEDIKERPIIKELSKMLGAKSSN